MHSSANHMASWVKCQVFQWHFIAFNFFKLSFVFKRSLINSRLKTSVGWLACKYFLQICNLSFHSLNSVFTSVKVLKFEVQFSSCFFYENLCFGITSNYSLPNYFPYNLYILSVLSLSSMIQFKFIFMYFKECYTCTFFVCATPIDAQGSFLTLLREPHVVPGVEPG